MKKEELNEAIRRVGNTAQAVNIEMLELNNIILKICEITARGGYVIGNSLKTIFTRLQRSDVSESLKRYGIETRNSDKSMRNGLKILEDLAYNYDKLKDVEKIYICELVGGVFQISITRALLEDK